MRYLTRELAPLLNIEPNKGIYLGYSTTEIRRRLFMSEIEWIEHRDTPDGAIVWELDANWQDKLRDEWDGREEIDLHVNLKLSGFYDLNVLLRYFVEKEQEYLRGDARFKNKKVRVFVKEEAA